MPEFSNLAEMIEQSVSRFRDRPVFGTKSGGAWHWMTYGELGERIDRLRAGLAGLGVGRGDRVGVIADNRPEWAIGAYATYGLGAAYVPMYEAQLAKDWEYILRDCGAKVVLVATASIAEKLAEVRGNLPKLEHVVVMAEKAPASSIAWNDLLVRGKAAPVQAIHPPGKEIAGFIYTSGTTGNPKGVLLSHSNLSSNVNAVNEIFPMGPEDRSLSFLPWAHSFGQTVELHSLISMGASLGIAESVEKIIDNLSEVRPTLLFSVPRIFNKIYTNLQLRMDAESGLKKKLFYSGLANAAKKKELEGRGRSAGLSGIKHRFFDKVVFSKVRARFGGRLKYAFSGGAAISKEVAEFIDNLGITVYEGYGLTETSPIATANWPGARKIGSVGKSIPKVEIMIDAAAATGDGNAVRLANPLEQGEVLVKGPNVMVGYHGLPDEDAKVFTGDHVFRTGDLGYLDPDGFLYITGRIKEQYKLENGKYVAPAPLEEKLKLSPYVANAMVYGDNKPFNVALIVINTESVGKWARENGVDASGPALCAHPRVRALMDEQVEKYSSDFKQFEKIRKVALIDEDFSTQNDMLTPSLKVKRRVVMKKWGEKIAGLF